MTVSGDRLVLSGIFPTSYFMPYQKEFFTNEIFLRFNNLKNPFFPGKKYAKTLYFPAE